MKRLSALALLLIVAAACGFSQTKDQIIDDLRLSIEKDAKLFAAWMTTKVNGRMAIGYERTWQNWKANYEGNGACDPLPIPPLKVHYTAVWRDAGPCGDALCGEGWIAEMEELPEPVSPMWLPDSSKLSNSCRQKLGLPEAPPPPIGVTDIAFALPDGRLQAGPGDTNPEGKVIAYQGKQYRKAFYYYPFAKVGLYIPQ